MRRSLPAWLLAAFTWVLLLAQFADLGHLVVVRHRLCPEHGELVHALDAPALARGARSVASNDSATIHADASSKDCHEHCAVAFQRRERATLNSPRSSIAPAQSALIRTERGVEISRASTLSLYRLAPKTSPPV